RMSRRAPRTIEEWNPPQRPRSEVMTTTSWTVSLPVPASSAGAPSCPAMLAASEPSMRSMRSAYGRAASACSCARRSFAAATIFMADVIFCVDLTLLILMRRSLRLGMCDLFGAYDDADLFGHTLIVIPAKAGIQGDGAITCPGPPLSRG